MGTEKLSVQLEETQLSFLLIHILTPPTASGHSGLGLPLPPHLSTFPFLCTFSSLLPSFFLLRFRSSWVLLKIRCTFGSFFILIWERIGVFKLDWIFFSFWRDILILSPVLVLFRTRFPSFLPLLVLLLCYGGLAPLLSLFFSLDHEICDFSSFISCFMLFLLLPYTGLFCFKFELFWLNLSEFVKTISRFFPLFSFFGHVPDRRTICIFH